MSICRTLTPLNNLSFKGTMISSVKKKLTYDLAIKRRTKKYNERNIALHNETKYNRERKIDFPPSSTTGKHFFVDQLRNEKRRRDVFDLIHENIDNVTFSFRRRLHYYIYYSFLFSRSYPLPRKRSS